MIRSLQQGFVAASLLSTGFAWGQTSNPAPPGQASAREHFQAGVARAHAGELEGAIREFESAYAAQPHYSVLYNIAQAQAGLGRTALAIGNFERYLQEGANEIPSGRRAEVQAFLESARKRVGAVQIVPADSTPLRVWLDGTELSPDAFVHPIAVNVGKHQLLYWPAAGGSPTVLEVNVESAETTEARLRPPPPAPAQTAHDLAQLRVDCPVPGTTVTVNGAKLAETPLKEPLLIATGNVEIRLSRTGYPVVDRRLTIAANQFATVECASQPQAPLPPEARSSLRVHTHQSGIRVSVNGMAVAQPAVLPAGPHDLRVDAPGFLPYRGRIVLEPGKLLELDVTLKPTTETLKSARQQRNLGYALGGSGIVLMTAAGALTLWNGHRYDTWEAGPRTDMQRVASLQRTDDIAFGCLFAGVGLVAGGIWALASAH